MKTACPVRLFFIYQLCWNTIRGTGSGHNEFSCVSSQKIRDTPCKEHTGNFFPLESCTGRHRKSKIVTLSSWLLMQGATLLLVGSFAIDLIVSRTAFLSQLVIYCSPSTALWCWQAQPVSPHQLAQVGYIDHWARKVIWEWERRGALYFCAFHSVAGAWIQQLVEHRF